jgi:2-polyprenyl-3-methyl-5-hydroxy-6-metoxy-1,4-benzoquinol methylase
MSKYSENIPESIIGAIGWFYDDIPEGSKVLDFGCSTGYYGSYIKEHKKCTVYGVEISEDKYAARKVLDGVYSFDLDGDWPTEVYERTYDVIFFGDVIEHLKDPGEVLKKSLKLLKKDGKIFISTPNVAHISVRLELLGGGFEYENMGILDNTHLKYFTLNSLTSIVTTAGYDIIRIDSSESDYPKEIIQSLLEKYGLVANEIFWKMVADPTARAFQYKLVLSPTSKGSKAKPIPKPIKKPEQYKADYIRNLNKELDNRQSRIDELVKLLDDTNKLKYELREFQATTTKRNEDLESDLSRIKNSKSYKLAQRLSQARNSLKRTKK